MMPSCVPAIPSEEVVCIKSWGYAWILDDPRILGLGEVMDCGAVIDCEPSMMDKLDLFKYKINDGHAIGIMGKRYLLMLCQVLRLTMRA